jgi:NAD-dependent DNA ligase
MQNVLEVVVIPGLRRMIADIDRYQSAYTTQVAKNEEDRAAFAATLSSKDEANSQARADTAALDSRKSQEIADLRRSKDDAESARESAESEKEAIEAQLTAQVNDLARQLQMKTEEVRVLKQRKRAVETDTSPDGTVTAVAEGGGYVVIDLGKSDNLIAGTNFDVYAIGKGGREIPKGTIKVIRVDNGTAQAQVMQQYDAYNPLVAGDQLRSLTYSPKETIHVALVGRFSKMGRSDAAARLKALGVVVDDVVGVDTHYLVVGSPESEAEPIEETAEFKSAEMYGITTISERELSRFTMY